MTYQELTGEQSAAVYAVQQMSAGQSAISAAEALVADAERSGDPVFLAWALSQYVEELTSGGEVHRSLVPIARLTRLLEGDPSRFDPFLHDRLLWSTKRVIKVLVDDPNNSDEVIERWIGEAERRLAESGHSLRPGYQARANWALQQGRLDDAVEMTRQMMTAESDAMADCPTCEEHFYGVVRAAVGDESGALHHWRRVLSGELEGCRWEPHRTRGRFLQPGFRSGAVDEVVSAHIAGVAAARREPGMLVPMAYHIEFCAVTHNEARGVEIANDYRLTYDADDADRAEYLASLALLARRLVELGHGDIEVRDLTGTMVPAARLAVDARAEVEEIAARFAKRDGAASSRERQLRDRLDATPISERQLPLGLAVSASPHASLPLANPTPGTGGPDAANAATEGSSVKTAPPEPAALLERARASAATLAPGTDEAWLVLVPNRDDLDLTERERIDLDLVGTGVAEWSRRNELAARFRAVGAEQAALRVEAGTVETAWWRTTDEGVAEWLRIARSRSRVDETPLADLPDVVATMSSLMRTMRRLPPDIEAVDELVEEILVDLESAVSRGINPVVPAEAALRSIRAASTEEFDAAVEPIIRGLFERAGDDDTVRAEAMRMQFTIESSTDGIDDQYEAVVHQRGLTNLGRMSLDRVYFDCLMGSGRFDDAARSARRSLIFAQSAVMAGAIDEQYQWAARLGRALSMLDRDQEAVGVLESFVGGLDQTQVAPSTFLDVLDTLADAYRSTDDGADPAAELRIRLAQFADEFGSLYDRLRAAMSAGYALLHARRFDESQLAFSRAEELAAEMEYGVGALDATLGVLLATEDLAERLAGLDQMRQGMQPILDAMRADAEGYDHDAFLTWVNMQAAIFEARDAATEDAAGLDAAIEEGRTLLATIDEIAPELVPREMNRFIRLVVLHRHANRIDDGHQVIDRLLADDPDLGWLRQWFDDNE